MSTGTNLDPLVLEASIETLSAPPAGGGDQPAAATQGGGQGGGGQGGQGQPEPIQVRPIDGSGSNASESDWGAAGQTLLRLGPAAYDDGLGAMVTDRPEPRTISNEVVQQDEEMPSSFGVSNFLWAWGQFIDHDLDLTEAGETEFAPIVVPVGDPWFDPDGTGGAFVPFTRVDPLDGSGITSPRAYENQITSFLDASMVYGSDAETAAALRDGGGRLLIGDDGMLPLADESNLLAGDVRAAENVALSSLHTLFVREHNRWVEILEEEHPGWSDDDLYHAARQRVEAEIQAITFNDFLPVLVGEQAIAAYQGYDETVNPGISVEFSTAAYRFGHSLLSATIEQQNEDGSTVAEGDLALRDAFFNPAALAETGIDPILRGLASSKAQELDPQVVEDVRSFLFGQPGAGGLDLAAINIQRGRDLGVPSYNDLREALGLERAEDFSDITSNAERAQALASVYGEVDLVDAWVGGLAEDPAGGLLGETFALIVIDQFERLRDGDPYWSEAGGLGQKELEALWETGLADIIEANSGVGTIQDNIFFAYERMSGDAEANEMVGDAGSLLMLGFEGNDILMGMRGDDQIDGGANRDRLKGGAGDDVLDGGAGIDRLIGGRGDDLLEGGLGKDLFVFSLKSDHDRVVDFEERDSIRIMDADEHFDLKKALVQQGDDVLLTISEEASVLFEDMTKDELLAATMLFG